MEANICMDELREMRERLVSTLCSEMENGLEHINTEEAGEVADIIKDISETEKNLMKKCYYHHVIEAMEETGEVPHSKTPIADLKTMWAQANIQLRKKMKADLQELLNNMTV